MAVDADEASSALIAKLLAEDGYEGSLVNPSGEPYSLLCFVLLYNLPEYGKATSTSLVRILMMKTTRKGNARESVARRRRGKKARCRRNPKVCKNVECT